jgi:hypothetical protein
MLLSPSMNIATCCINKELSHLELSLKRVSLTWSCPCMKSFESCALRVESSLPNATQEAFPCLVSAQHFSLGSWMCHFYWAPCQNCAHTCSLKFLSHCFHCPKARGSPCSPDGTKNGNFLSQSNQDSLIVPWGELPPAGALH